MSTGQNKLVQMNQQFAEINKRMYAGYPEECFATEFAGQLACKILDHLIQNTRGCQHVLERSGLSDAELSSVTRDLHDCMLPPTQLLFENARKILDRLNALDPCEEGESPTSDFDAEFTMNTSRKFDELYARAGALDTNNVPLSCAIRSLQASLQEVIDFNTVVSCGGVSSIDEACSVFGQFDEQVHPAVKLLIENTEKLLDQLATTPDHKTGD